MKYAARLCYATLGFIGALLPAAFAAQAAEPTTLTIFAAGTLAVPFRQVSTLFEKKYPNVTVQAQYGGSVMMAKKITDLHQDADLLAVADYNVIPKYLFGNPAYAAWYAGFARNAITFVYTDKSKYANEINSEQLVQGAGPQGRRDRPLQSGYRPVGLPDRADAQSGGKILQSAGPGAERAGQRAARQHARHRDRADFRAATRADRLSGDLPLRRLAASSQVRRPAGQDQSQRPGRLGLLPKGIAHTKNGDLAGKPIVYAITIVNGSKNAELAEKYVALVLGPEGQAVMKNNGFGEFSPAYAVHADGYAGRAEENGRAMARVLIGGPVA